MGMMVVTGTGKGISGIELDEEMPFGVAALKDRPLNDFLAGTRGENTVFVHAEEFSPVEKAYIIGLAHTDYLYGADDMKPGEWTAKDVKEQMEKDYACDRRLLRSLAPIFEIEYRYPLRTFRSVQDYDDNTMLYLKKLFPFSDPELTKRFSGMSEGDLAKEMNEFMKKVTGENIEYEIETCEEWWKE